MDKLAVSVKNWFYEFFDDATIVAELRPYNGDIGTPGLAYGSIFNSVLVFVRFYHNIN